jgi:hypothetical protein
MVSESTNNLQVVGHRSENKGQNGRRRRENNAKQQLMGSFDGD